MNRISFHHPRPASRLALGALVVLNVAMGISFVAFGRINHDEGWYLYASRLVYEGSLPYRDFAFFQAPLLPYVYGIPQLLFGPSVAVGRWTSFVLSLVTVALGARLCFERGGRLGALVFLFGISLTPAVLWSFTTTRTEPLSAFLLMAAVFLTLRKPPRPTAAGGALVAATLAAATRVSSVPAAVFLLIWTLRRHRLPRRQLVLVLLPALSITVSVVSVVLISDPRAAWFDIIEAQAQRHDQLKTAPAWGATEYLTTRARAIVGLSTSFGFVPLLSAVVLAIACAAIVARFRRRALSLPDWGIGLPALAAVVYVPNLLPRALFPEYFVPAFSLFLAAIACWTGDLFRRAAAPGRFALAAALAGLLFFQAATFTAQLEAHSSGEDPDLQELRKVAAYLREVVPAGGKLVTMDTYLAVQSGIAVAPGWEMGPFAYFPLLPEEGGFRFKVMTNERFRAALRDRSTAAVVLSDYDLGILVDRRYGPYRPFKVLTDGELHQALPDLGDYHLAKVFEKFGQFRDSLYVLLP